MTPKQKYIESQTKDCRERWFKDHVAVWIDKPAWVDSAAIAPTSAMLISWQNPKSWNYGCRFIIHRRWLCIVGDIGEAVFQWSEDLTLDFLAGIDLHYFLGKCQASPEGRKFEQWDGKVAWQINRQWVEGEPLDTDLCEYLTELDKDSTKEDYEEQAKNCYDDTGDAETASTISDMGVVPSVHAIGMFVGLQMAIAQLKAAK